MHSIKVRATIWAIGRENWWSGSKANSAQTEDGAEIVALALYEAIDKPAAHSGLSVGITKNGGRWSDVSLPRIFEKVAFSA